MGRSSLSASLLPAVYTPHTHIPHLSTDLHWTGLDNRHKHKHLLRWSKVIHQSWLSGRAICWSRAIHWSKAISQSRAICQSRAIHPTRTICRSWAIHWSRTICQSRTIHWSRPSHQSRAICQEQPRELPTFEKKAMMDDLWCEKTNRRKVLITSKMSKEICMHFKNCSTVSFRRDTKTHWCLPCQGSKRPCTMG